MKKRYKTVMQKHFRDYLLQTRGGLQLTQAKMAKMLLMEDRSYAALESGESCCGALTLALFLIYCCNDPADFLEGLRKAMEASDHAV